MARRPKPVTAERVQRWCQWYLERWSSSEANVARILWRKARRSMAEHGGDSEAIEGWIQDAVARARTLGWVNDTRYAHDVAAAQRRRGASERSIRQRLMQKGVPHELVAETLDAQGADAEITAAAGYARRRHLGPWRRAPADRDARQKELARLGRAGFPFDIARRLVDAETPEDLLIPGDPHEVR